MQTFLSLIALFTTALWLMLFILAARFIHLWTYANLRMGVVPSAGRAAPAVGNTQRCRQSSASRKLARQKGKRHRHNVRSKRGGTEPYRDVDERLNLDDCYTEIGSRLGAYPRFNNGISTQECPECPGQRSGYDRIILIVNCENAARGRRLKRRRG